ncbi:MAG: flagellar biosynthesis protein FlhF [Nitrospirae bacterium]|nr:flagellar biosynthesis protein FlhF [Nitrospirota bacterium]
MKIKKFQARNFSEALAQVKRELGEDAVILSSEDKKGARSFVEITAAVDYDVDTSGAPGINSPAPFFSKPEQGGTSSPSVHNSDIRELKNELRSLRESIEIMRNSGFEMTLPENRRNIFYFLREKSIKDEFALSIIERTNSIEELETIMTDDMNSARLFTRKVWDMSCQFSRRMLMLIGPTGVGKTTTIAKLASKAIKEGRKVGIIGVDTFKIGAIEQIRIYSKMIGIPLEVVSGTEELKKGIRKLSDRDVILIDTTGQNPRDNEYIRSLKDVYKMGLPVETQLLLSASSDNDFLMETHKHYGALPIDYIAFTKTDEAVKLGSIYNLCRIYKKPVAYITTGQRVPGNIEFVDNKKLTNLILRTGSA